MGSMLDGLNKLAELAEKVKRAISHSHRYFRDSQHPDGYWWGELESNPTMEAEYLMLSHFLGRKNPERWRKVANYILGKQQNDGSWGQYYEAPGDVSTSVECYFALKLAGHPADSPELTRAREFIISRGGVPKTRVFTKIWLALFGQWEWSGTPNLPPELMLLPSWAPFNIYEFSSWARATIVPMSIILTERPYCEIPDSARIDELYPNGREATDFSLSVPDDWISRGLFTLDRLMNLYRKVPMQPLRGLARQRAIQWILEHQEADGAWGGIQPPWVYSLIALHHAGEEEFADALDKGFDGFDSFAIEDEDTCSVQACISPVWDTCLAQLALLESGVADNDPMVQLSSRWLMDNQILAEGDWQVRAKDTPPGGWAFEFHNEKYPDIDDSSEVIIALALARLEGGDETDRQEAIRRGVEWIEGMQSRSGGWAAFDKDNDRWYVARIPFSDFGETLDPPSADVTAHILEMYGRLGYSMDHPPVQRGYQYLLREQEEDGPWFGRWGVNYIYGAGAALPAFEAIGEDMGQPYVRRAVEWLMAHQNDDGGWGECCGSYVDESLRGVGTSTASQTAWALLALIAAGEAGSEACYKGISYLLDLQQPDGSWDEPYFTGTGFPGYRVGQPPKGMPKPGEADYQGLDMPAGFMINYHLYRNYWPLLALGRFARAIEQARPRGSGERQPTVSEDHRKKEPRQLEGAASG
ncbi:MAG: squalene--hopene cyclase [Chloroflexi bacterium]|nr:squalene--hopene cyclase [Chloroflexota bacterium]MYE38692.1 squalene--hopene cyclase [Chloroflexota bacterium]